MGVARIGMDFAERHEMRTPPFVPRFMCRTCGPTNHVIGDPSGGFVCWRCEASVAAFLERELRVKYL